MKNKSLIESIHFHKMLIFILAFVFYYNTIPNDVALDDVLVLTNNQFVIKGVQGIPDIVSHESFYGAIGQNPGQLGWRYRPFSIVVLAIEHQFFGNNWHVYHFFNVLFYAILCIVIYNFLRSKFFPDSNFTALLATLIFTVHPMHSEVVANIKSLDEIFALMFSVLFLDRYISYSKNKKTLSVLFSFLFLIFALLSKESSVLLLGFTPLALWVINKSTFKECALNSLPIVILVVLYIAFRFNISAMPHNPNDISNEPYFYANGIQKAATISLILGNYIIMILWPVKQVFDYGYNQIPYVTFSDWRAIASVMFYTVLIGFGIFYTFKREKIGLCILFYLIGILLVSNIVINIGAPMADRFVFAPGLFFITAIFLLLNKVKIKMEEKYKTIATFSCMFIIVLFSFLKVHARNKEWKDNKTLYLADVVKSPESFRILGFCGTTLVSESDAIPDSITRDKNLKLALNYFRKAYSIYPNFIPMYEDWGGAYSRLNNIDSAEWVWNRLKVLKPNSKFISSNEEIIAKLRYNVLFNQFQKAIPQNNIPELMAIHRKAMSYYDKMPSSWSTLGKLFMMENKKDSAIWAFNICKQMDPENADAKLYLPQLENINTVK